MTAAFAKVAPASLLVQVLSLGSSIVLASQLGATTRTDAYYLALSVPVVVYAVLVSGIRLGGIPALTRIAAGESQETFDRSCGELVTAVLAVSIALSILITGVMAAGLPAIAGGSHRLSSLTRLFLVELSPYAVTGAALGVLGAILAVKGRFALLTLVLGIEPVFKSVLLILFRRELGVQALVIGNVVGNLLAAGIVWRAVRRAPIRLRLTGFRNSRVVRSVFALSAPLILSQIVLQLNPLIDRAAAAELGKGAITELELGTRLFSAPITLLTGMMIAPLAAGWSARFEQGGWPAVTQSLRRLLATVILVIPPLIVVGFILRHQLVSLVYGSSRYSPTAVRETSQVLGMLLLGLLPQILTVPMATLFVIRGDTIFPMKIGFLNCALNAILDFALRGPLGVSGVALGTSITYGVLVGVYVIRAEQRWGGLDLRSLRRVCVLAVVSTALLIPIGMGELQLQRGSSRADELAGLLAVAIVATVVHVITVTVGRGWRDTAITGRIRAGSGRPGLSIGLQPGLRE